MTIIAELQEMVSKAKFQKSDMEFISDYKVVMDL